MDICSQGNSVVRLSKSVPMLMYMGCIESCGISVQYMIHMIQFMRQQTESQIESGRCHTSSIRDHLDKILFSRV